MSDPFDTPPITPPADDPFAGSGQPTEPSIPSDPMAELVGEGKKYATAEEAVKALAHSQTHIAKLETENRAIRDQVAKIEAQQQQTTAIKDMIAEAIQQQTSVQPNTPLAEPPVTGDSGMTPDQVSQLVADAMSKQASTATQQQNLDTVSRHLITQYGSEANKITHKVAADAGMSADQLKDMARTHPAMVLQLFKQHTTPAVPGSVTPPPADPELPKGNALHGLPGAFVPTPPANREPGKYQPSVLRGANGKEMVEEFKKSYPTEAVEQMRKAGQL